jgi:hypothetical protein
MNVPTEDFEEISADIEDSDELTEAINNLFHLIHGAKLHAEYISTTYTECSHGYCALCLLEDAVHDFARINKYIRKELHYD